jgi:hypothetical protein
MITEDVYVGCVHLTPSSYPSGKSAKTQCIRVTFINLSGTIRRIAQRVYSRRFVQVLRDEIPEVLYRQSKLNNL